MDNERFRIPYKPYYLSKEVAGYLMDMYKDMYKSLDSAWARVRTDMKSGKVRRCRTTATGKRKVIKRADVLLYLGLTEDDLK